MALRSALCQLAPKLMGSAQAAAPLATKAFGFAQQFSQVLSQQEKPRSFATDAVKVMKGEPSVAAADILSKTPTHYIDYDDHAHARFEPGTEGRPFAYFVQTGSRFFYASAARLAILKAVVSLSAAADTLAISSLEVDLSGLEEGSQMTVKWRGKPVFIKHRTDAEIASLSTTNLAELRDQQTDAQRALNPKYLVIVGICTHLGCVPIAGAGNYEGGWFCPCHGSHYDGSGRIREGPAPFNLEVPEYKFLDEKKIVIG